MHNNSKHRWYGFVLSMVVLAFHITGFAQTNYPVCSSSTSDADGDGWGWENNRSCIVAISVQSPGPTASYPNCTSVNSDPDGDGFGFENGVSCVVIAPRGTGANFPTCQTDSDADGDGFGFENGVSCIVPAPATGAANGGFPVCQTDTDADGDGFGWENQATCIIGDKKAKVITGGSVDLTAITDVVLVTGQSNVLASHTSFDAVLDQSHPRVFAFTDNGWRVADLHQVWDVYAHPGNHSQVNPANQPYNNFAMHFGKTLASNDPNRNVAFIVASAPGKGIAHWDKGSAFYQFVSNKVTRALQAIPHKYHIDGVLWQQGENDWLYEGTSDAAATGFSSTNSDAYRNYYKIKLESLISNIRGESWAVGGTAFICGETRRALGVNRRLMALNTDSDQLTACVPATDLPKRSDDPYGSHFSAAGLRELGKRYANQYRTMTGG